MKLGRPLYIDFDRTGWVSPEYGGSVTIIGGGGNRTIDDDTVILRRIFPMANNNPTTTTTPNTTRLPITAQCNCLVGNPYIDASGNCACTSHDEPFKVSNTLPVNNPTYNNPSVTNLQNTLIQTLQDNPLLALGGAALLLYLIFGNKGK